MDINTSRSTHFLEPGQTNIYETHYLDQTKAKEFDTANRRFQESQTPLETNIIPPQLNHDIFNKSHAPEPINIHAKGGQFVSELTGNVVETNQIHNNMTPFFGSRIRQSTNTDNNVSRNILGNHTGIETFANPKKESKPLFDPVQNRNAQAGMIQNTDDIAGRFNPSNYRKTELPFEQVRVGPGINQGYTAEPSGGFNQDAREYILPKTIDELRPKSRPQITYRGRMIPGKSAVDKRGQEGQVVQYKPDTFFENTPDRYMTTTGAYVKDKQRPMFIMKDTNRKSTKGYAGSAGPASQKNPTSRNTVVQETTRQSLQEFGSRNAYSGDSWTNVLFGDYGKSGLENTPNERDLTSERTHLTNFASIVKAMIAPITDLLPITKKEEVEANLHDSGFMGATTTQSGVVWDENDTARTTIKETLIHDEYMGNINTTTNQGSTVLDKEEMKFKTTVRETLDPEDFNVNMRVVEKGVATDPDDMARRTVKETTLVGSMDKNLKGTTKLYVYDPDLIARRTIRETITKQDHCGNVGGPGVNREGAYQNANYEAHETQRQFTSDTEYVGIMDGETKGGRGYLTADYYAPETNKQFTSDVEYSGTAQSMYKKQMSYEDKYNARTNIVREGTLVGRMPTVQGVKQVANRDMLNIHTNKREEDQVNTREPTGTKITNLTNPLSPVSLTTQNRLLSETSFLDRIQPEFLDAFRSNPYTQSLQSYAYT